MKLRLHRRDLLLSDVTIPAGKPRATRSVRPWRIRWQPVFLFIGALVLVIGLILRSSVAFVLGLLVMGSATSDIGAHSPTAATVRTWMWLHKGRADNLRPGTADAPLLAAA